MWIRGLCASLPLILWTEVIPASGQSATTPPTQQLPLPDSEAPNEVVVVTASRREEQLINAPATMTVISEETIRTAAVQTVPELLRVVPGMNVAQLSARDINVESRAPSGTLTDSLLVLLDGRSFYQDFFGAVMWDFLPIAVDEIKQIEVIRGPASAVWGANAMTGVVNVISKTPREMQGTIVAARFGQFDRTPAGSDFDGGGIIALQARHAAAPSDRFAFKLSAELFAQEAFLRPTGEVGNRQTPYPAYTNRGTRQPRLDARADYEFADGDRRLILAGGIAGTEGIIHSGLGPFDIERGSTMKYGRIAYSRQKMKLQMFVNALDGNAPVVLQQDAAGRPVQTSFENQAYDFEYSNENVLGTRHLLSYGGNFRHNSFDISLAPRGDSRDEAGLYVQDQIFFTERVRWIAGARLDWFDNLHHGVLSPRTALIFKAKPQHTLRLSFNRAFRAPSFLNSYFAAEFYSDIDLGAAGSFRLPSAALGNVDLKEESLTAYEVGYTGTIGRLTTSAAVYLNQTRNMILFTQVRSYTSANPPPGWPLTPAALDALQLPREYSYRNFGRVTDHGVELSGEARLKADLSGFANYTWQKPSFASGVDRSEFNVPPAHVANIGLGFTRPRYFGSISVSLHDKAFWQDVLDARFHGRTPPYTLVNAAIGVDSSDGRLTGVVRARNLLNSSKQQHVFGDVLRRSVTGELRVSF